MAVRRLFPVGWAREALRARKRGVKLNERAYRVANKLVGLMESGGNNMGPGVSDLIRANGGTVGEPWCGDFVAFCYRTAGSKKVTRSWAAVRLLFAGSTVRHLGNVKRGDVVRYDFTGPGSLSHTGLFAEWIVPGKSFRAIEGNTRATGSASDAGGGEGVGVRERTVSQVHDFRRVAR